MRIPGRAYAGHQWVIIDAKIYDLSKFKNLHPGGGSVLLDPEVGKDYLRMTKI